MAELPPLDLHPPKRSPATLGDWVLGVLLSVLLPVAGLVLGCVFYSKGGSKAKVGVWCICISISMLPVWLATVLGSI